MFKKIIELVRENRRNQKKLISYSRELNWADVYHDSIRGEEWLEKLPLNVGRWAGNYSFFYILNRILSDFQPQKILELGLGESSKFINNYILNKLVNSSHLIIEQDEQWKEFFLNKNKSLKGSDVNIHPIKEIEVNSHKVLVYKDIDKILSQKFDLYIVDGPKGSKKYSRYDMVKIGESLNIGDEFIIVIDDFHRPGEKSSVQCLLNILNGKNINYYQCVYYGLKEVLVIGTEKYKHIRSL